MYHWSVHNYNNFFPDYNTIYYLPALKLKHTKIHTCMHTHTDTNDHNVERDILQGVPRGMRMSRRNVNDQLDVRVAGD